MEDFSDNAIKGEMIGHPKPDFVSQLRDKDKVRIKFLSMIESKTPSDSLEKALKSVRDAVTYDQEKHRKGLPPMLLARLPGDLLDVLLLLAIRRGADQPWSEPDNEILCAFVLHWLLFVCNNEKAALIAFRHNLDIDWKFNIDSIQNLIKKYEDEGIARIIPRSDQLDDLRKQVREEKGQRLRQWAERFTAVDGDGEGNPGEALRVLSTNDNLEKRALMWLQRDFIMAQYPYYDPTSSRDEDLPVDLDHLIPYSNFGFDWRRKEQYLMQDVIKNKNILENFRNERHMIGNSLGNYRWLGARDNRRRGNGCLEELENCGDLVSNVCDWNTLIPNCGDNGKWSRDSISSFQRLIDLRTIDLYEIILTDSDIENILPRR